ncbi:MAG: sensor histidine kinase [Coprobacillaceae bacterium]
MIIITVISILLLCIAILYIYHLRNSLKKIAHDLKNKKNQSTNTILTSESNTKEIREVVHEVNAITQHYKQQEIQIEKKNKQLQKTIVNISHDLRTPLTSSIGYLELLQSYDMPEDKKKEYEKIIGSKLEELTNLIEDFFVFTKSISNNEEIVLEKLDINRIFEEAMITYYQDFTMRGRMLHIHGNQKVIITSNERMLRRIFNNIIGNALKHSEGDVFVNVEVKDKVSYTFTNTVHEKIEVERLFDEFYTADISRTKQQTGLGLALVKEFVEQLSGNVIAKQEGNQLHIILSWPLDNKE